MNDDQLLYAAALEAGFADRHMQDSGLVMRKENISVHPRKWNPLESMDEAIELAAKLKISISFGEGCVHVHRDKHSCLMDNNLASVRRAIVLIAAGISETAT